MIGPLPDGWHAALAPVLARAEVAGLEAFLADEIAAGTPIFPSQDRWLAAFALTPLDQVRVVILGQDPYHGPGQAMGLSFSVPGDMPLPPSLRNIFAELESDLGIARPQHGDLSGWARQGVLLLNTSLTVAAGQAGSHAGRGWEALSHAALAAVAARQKPSVFVLWGNHAQAVGRQVAGLDEGEGRHLIIESPHPSPLSARRGFFGSRPFSRANAFLEARGRGTVDWAG